MMIQHNSHTEQGMVAYKSGFPFMDKEFQEEVGKKNKETPTPFMVETPEAAAVEFVNTPDFFSQKEMIPLWPSLTEMIQTLGNEYQWKHELHNMLIVRSIFSGVVFIVLMALGLLLL